MELLRSLDDLMHSSETGVIDHCQVSATPAISEGANYETDKPIQS